MQKRTYETTPPDVLSRYLHAFGHLHRNKGIAPHKPILLLSILDEIGRGHIVDNEVVLSVELVAAFREYWSILPLPAGNWLERIWIPFRYLTQDGFWELVKDGETLTGKEVGEPTSVSDMRSRVHFARFVPELWLLLQDATARDVLRVHLLQTCFGILPGQVQPVVPADPLAAQRDRLILEAQRPPKPRKVRETQDDTLYYVRHALFPEVIYALYDSTCAVCRLRAKTDRQNLVEAAHIRPFAEFHDDHPSNGLALCKNHHWGFDAGAFAVKDDYTLEVSPRLQDAAGFLTEGAKLHLPSAENCVPDPEALEWHRENRFLK